MISIPQTIYPVSKGYLALEHKLFSFTAKAPSGESGSKKICKALRFTKKTETLFEMTEADTSQNTLPAKHSTLMGTHISSQFGIAVQPCVCPAFLDYFLVFPSTLIILGILYLQQSSLIHEADGPPWAVYGLVGIDILTLLSTILKRSFSAGTSFSRTPLSPSRSTEFNRGKVSRDMNFLKKSTISYVTSSKVSFRTPSQS